MAEWGEGMSDMLAPVTFGVGLADDGEPVGVVAFLPAVFEDMGDGRLTLLLPEESLVAVGRMMLAQADKLKQPLGPSARVLRSHKPQRDS